MSFSIEITDDPIPENWKFDNEVGYLIEIRINDFVEKDSLLTGYWNKSQYIEQWQEAVSILTKSKTNTRAAFATAVHNPLNPGHGYVIQWWTAYKFADMVLIRSGAVQEGINGDPVDLKNIYDYVPEYNSDEAISEWRATVQDISEFGSYLDDLSYNESRIEPTSNTYEEILEGPKHRCKRCRGTGQIPGIRKTMGMGKGMGSQFGACPECDGSGWLYGNPISPKTSKIK